MHEFSIVTAVI